MMKNSRSVDFFALHIVVLFWGATGLVGDMITLPVQTIVFYRMAIALLPLIIYVRWVQGHSLAMAWRERGLCLLSGLCIAAHWWCFFQAIKVSTVSIGLICLSAGPFFLALLEPLMMGSRIRPSELCLGLACVASLTVIFEFEPQYGQGIAYGIASALIDAFYAMLSSRLVKKEASLVVTTYQMIGGTLAFLLANFMRWPDFAWLKIGSMENLWGLLFLGILCTALALAVYTHCLRSISAFSAVLALNLEPVYGILLALLLYGEKEVMSLGFYAGASLLVASVAIDAALKRRAALAQPQ